MKVHLSKVTPNRWGGFNTTSLCGRLNKQSTDGMNLTGERKEVTCGFCLKLMAHIPDEQKTPVKQA